MARPTRLLHATLILALAFAATGAAAGEIGAVSRATVAISLSVAPHMQIQGVSNPATAAVQPDETRNNQFCVSANTATRSYGVSLIARPAGTGGASGAGNFTVEWADAPDRSRGVAIPAGATVTGFVAAARDCSVDRRASASLIVRREAGAAAPNESLPATLLIVPE